METEDLVRTGNRSQCLSLQLRWSRAEYLWPGERAVGLGWAVSVEMEIKVERKTELWVEREYYPTAVMLSLWLVFLPGKRVCSCCEP